MGRNNISSEKDILKHELEKRGLDLDNGHLDTTGVFIPFKDPLRHELVIDSAHAVVQDSIKNIVNRQRTIGTEQRPLTELTKHTIYLFNESKPNLGLKTFAGNIKDGVASMALTRRHPELLPHDELDLKDTIFYWLTTNRGEFCIDPTNISRLYRIIVEFMDDYDKTLIYMDGLEYLISRNSFPTVIKFLYSVNDKVMITDCVMVLSTNLATYSKQEQALFLREISRPDFE